MTGDPEVLVPSAIAALLNPVSVALIGASDKSRWSAIAFDNLTQGGYQGRLHLINPRGAMAHGRQTATSCAAAAAASGAPVALGLIMTPTAAVPDALAGLAAAGGSAAVILSAGFAETGAAGAAAQEQVRAAAAQHRIRLLGPNCLGFINFVNRAYVWTTPVKAPSRNSGVGVVSQSGATAHFLSTLAHQQDIGLSYAISTGNEADLDGAAFVDFLIDDPSTRAIAMFAETFRSPARFRLAAARALHAAKPLVVLKIGASDITVKSALAHTGSLVGDDKVFDGICAQYGVIRARSMEDLLATADIAGRTGVLRAGGLAVVTNSGGVGEIAADTAHLRGIALAALTLPTETALRATIPDSATPHNPIDLTGSVTPEQCEGVVRVMGAQTDVAALLCPWYQVPTEDDQISERLTQLHHHLGRGLAAVSVPGFLVSYTNTLVNDLARRTIAAEGLNYLACGLDRALTGLAGAFWWSQRQREHARKPMVGAGVRDMLRSGAVAEVASAAARQVVSGAVAEPVPVDAATDRVRPRSEREALACLSRQGVPVVPATLAVDAAQAVAAARTLGGTVVLKIASPDIAHKSDIGGVALNLQGDDAVRTAFTQMMAAARSHCPDARIEGVIVAPMRERGIELLVGFTRDPQWGPVLAVGLGGVWVEIMQDVALRLLPVDADEVKRMLGGLRGAKLLQGQRGNPAADVDKVAQVIARIGDVLLACGDALLEADINPLWVRGDQVEALDALLIWADAPPAGATPPAGVTGAAAS